MRGYVYCSPVYVDELDPGMTILDPVGTEPVTVVRTVQMMKHVVLEYKRAGGGGIVSIVLPYRAMFMPVRKQDHDVSVKQFPTILR